MTTSHAERERIDRFREDLEQVFGRRLRGAVAYETHFGFQSSAGRAPAGAPQIHTLVLVESLTFADLMACAGRAAAWQKAHIAIPLLLPEDDFRRSLDAFPLEFNAIKWHHSLVAGSDPFEGVTIAADDIRRACETQAKSHLIHLREGFLDTRGEPRGVVRLITASVPSLRTMFVNLARLDGVVASTPDALATHAAARLDVPVALIEQLLALGYADTLDASDAHRVYAAYLDAMERLARFLDRWNRQ